MSAFKKAAAVGAVTLLLVTGAVAPAQASAMTQARVQPQSGFWCTWAPWLPGCR